MTKQDTICVTGASGFIGSWLVQLCLDRGYTVNATVQNLNDEKETKHLLALNGAAGRLKLCQMDLLDYDSIVAAVTGTVGVLHLASPNITDKVEDPEKALLEPAIQGTENVLRAAKLAGCRRVVMTSSISAITPSPNWPGDVVKNEECWTDIEYCKQKGLWYTISKTLAEKAAWKFAKENDFDVVTINPGTALGPILPPILNSSMMVVVRLVQGSDDDNKDMYMGCAYVKDVALAHLTAFEHPEAAGRHLCVEAISHFSDFAAKVAELFPEYKDKIYKFPKETQPGLLRTKNASKKLMDLGMTFVPMDQVIKEAVESLKSRGII